MRRKRELFGSIASVLAAALVPDAGAAPSGAAVPSGDDFGSGRYVLVQETVTVAELPVVEDVVATTRAVSVQSLRRTGDWLRGDGRLCELTLSSGSSLVKTELPPAFRRAVPSVRTNARLEKKGEDLVFHQATQTLVLGARLEKSGDRLPTEPDDPRLVDADRDGHPGVTVRVSGIVSGDVYLVQRSTSRLVGRAEGGGFRGRVEFENEQSVVDATNPLLETGPDAEPDWSRSFFRLEKVADETTCEDAKRIAARLR